VTTLVKQLTAAHGLRRLRRAWTGMIGRRAATHTGPRAGDRPNIVILGLDTLRVDHLGCYGYARQTSPNIDRLAQSSTLFHNCFSTSAWTAPAWGSLFTGMLPSQHSLLFYPAPGALRPEFPTLAEALHEAGYVTGGFHGGGYVDAGFGFARGFLEYVTKGLRLGDSLESCRQWLRDNRRRPFFLFWHGYDCHMPYEPPAEFDRFDAGYRGTYDVSTLYMPGGSLPTQQGDHEHIVAKYDGEIAYSDSMVARILHELESLQLLDSTLIVVVSDHGEEFMEHGGYDHTRTLYDELIRVPLVVRFPHSSRAIQRSELISLVDLFPAICIWAGVEAPASHGMSPSQLRDAPREAVIAETGYLRRYLEDTEGLVWQHKKNRPELLRCVRNRRWKLMLDDRDQPHALFRLSEDPHEIVDLLEVKPGIAQELETAFHLHGSGIGASELALSPQEDHPLEARVQERLRALGYV